MKILKITLKTSELHNTIAFYNNVLELPIVRKWESGVTFQVGKSHLTFLQEGGSKTYYHVAFRTNSMHFDAMYNKLNNLGALLQNEDGNTSMFWKGKQLYFLDPSGNVFEILERENPYDHQIDGFYDICEIGIPSHSVEEMSQ
ncbi:VOC family protein [Bacillus alkalisoli]|nr:VOC family protein [Bacillus alkalisoli]